MKKISRARKIMVDAIGVIEHHIIALSDLPRLPVS